MREGGREKKCILVIFLSLEVERKGSECLGPQKGIVS